MLLRREVAIAQTQAPPAKVLRRVNPQRKKPPAKLPRASDCSSRWTEIRAPPSRLPRGVPDRPHQCRRREPPSRSPPVPHPLLHLSRIPARLPLCPWDLRRAVSCTRFALRSYSRLEATCRPLI